MFQMFYFWLSAHPGPIQVSKFNIPSGRLAPLCLKAFSNTLGLPLQKGRIPGLFAGSSVFIWGPC